MAQVEPCDGLALLNVEMMRPIRVGDKIDKCWAMSELVRPWPYLAQDIREVTHNVHSMWAGGVPDPWFQRYTRFPLTRVRTIVHYRLLAPGCRCHPGHKPPLAPSTSTGQCSVSIRPRLCTKQYARDNVFQLPARQEMVDDADRHECGPVLEPRLRG